MKWRAAATVLGAGIAVALAFPAGAAAHGLVGRKDLPVPEWLFAWAAAIVLIVSFVALGLLWSRPRLEGARTRPLLPLGRWADVVGGAVGIGAFVLVVVAGIAGTSVPTANLAPTFVYVVFWVALAIASALFGDLFRVLSPWRAAGRACGWAARRTLGARLAPRKAYPQRLGRWPAVAVLVGFAWLELVHTGNDDPALLAWLGLAYAAAMLAGMAVYGVDPWCDRADGFGVLFSMFARLSPFARRDGRLLWRRPLSGLTTIELVPGTVTVLLVMIGTTTFDGASNGDLWSSISPELDSLFGSLGFGQTAATELAFTVGLALSIALVAVVYALGVLGMRTVAPERSARELAGAFAHTLVPIALAYLVAHYFSLVAYQGQAMAYLVSDPLGTGADWFGTATAQVDYTLFSASFIWYVQVVALVAGHVGGLALAHDRALALFRDSREAVRSQYWMLTVMVGYTCLGLWLLSAVSS